MFDKMYKVIKTVTETIFVFKLCIRNINVFETFIADCGQDIKYFSFQM